MPTIEPQRSLLLVIDVQARLMPAIHDAALVIRNTHRLIEVAGLLNVPAVFTEQNPRGLGATVADLRVGKSPLVHKQSFDACRESGFLGLIPEGGHIIVAGCEAHVCVLQTVMGLLGASRATYVVRDAIGSRHPEDKDTALGRLAHHGADIVTTEMVLFEWLQTAQHPRFREAMAFIK